MTFSSRTWTSGLNGKAAASLRICYMIAIIANTRLDFFPRRPGLFFPLTLEVSWQGNPAATSTSVNSNSFRIVHKMLFVSLLRSPWCVQQGARALHTLVASGTISQACKRTLDPHFPSEACKTAPIPSQKLSTRMLGDTTCSGGAQASGTTGTEGAAGREGPCQFVGAEGVAPFGSCL